MNGCTKKTSVLRYDRRIIPAPFSANRRVSTSVPGLLEGSRSRSHLTGAGRSPRSWRESRDHEHSVDFAAQRIVSTGLTRLRQTSTSLSAASSNTMFAP